MSNNPTVTTGYIHVVYKWWSSKTLAFQGDLEKIHLTNGSLGFLVEFLEARNWNSKSLEVAGHDHLKVRSSESDFGNLAGF